jgi:ABC-type antimicrobial peptide transport system permease subunit
MFFTYLGRELRRRIKQAVFISLGLAIGVGLVITVTAASSGVQNAQGTVLHSLYGVGTDITVTKTPPKGSGGPGGFRVGGGSRPTAGTKFSRNTLTGISNGTLSSSSVTAIKGLKNVGTAAGALTLTDLNLSGTIPAAGNGGGGGGFGGGGGGGGGPTSINSSSFTVVGAVVSAGKVGPLSSSKLTSGRSFRSSDATANVALVDSNYATQNKLKAGSTISVGGSSGKATTFTVIGVVQAAPGATPANVYIPLARAQALGTGPGGVSLTGKVNTIYVAASSSADIGAVQKEISKQLPAATVTTSSTLASQVTGSVTSAASLASNLGKWLAIAVLIAAFCVASLLTMAAVSRRVREFGTLKALGWRTGRIVGQVMGETVTMGIIGGLVGAGLGFGGAALVSALAPPLTATTGSPTGTAAPGGPGGGPGGGGGLFGRLSASTVHTVSVHLTAPVTGTAIGLAVVLAVAGGLVAGTFGGWRAGRLRPAAALARLE